MSDVMYFQTQEDETGGHYAGLVEIRTTPEGRLVVDLRVDDSSTGEAPIDLIVDGDLVAQVDA